jgi:hypothetical protein
MVCEQKAKNNTFLAITSTRRRPGGARFDTSARMEGFPPRLAGLGFGRVGLVGLVGLVGRVGLRAARLLDRPAQDELDLPIQAAQIVVRPALEGLQQGRVDTKEKRLTFGHGIY